MVEVKYYSFQLNKKKYKHLMKWLEKLKEEENINISSMIRKLIEKEYERQKIQNSRN